MNKYKFDFEEVSVYACVAALLEPFLKENEVHLDIGCGNAAIQSKITEKKSVYIGTDLDTETIRKVKLKGIEGHLIDLNDNDKAINQFDEILNGRRLTSISMIDVIEHLEHPDKFLEALSNWLIKSHPNVKLVTSIPNFSHEDVAIRFFSGKWTYMETGLLDKTHKNILTRHSIDDLFDKSGWICRQENNYELAKTEQKDVTPTTAFANSTDGIGFQLRALKRLIDPDHHVYQFVNLWEPSDLPKLIMHSANILNILHSHHNEAVKTEKVNGELITHCTVDDIKSSRGRSPIKDAQYVIFNSDTTQVSFPVEFISEVLTGTERPVLLSMPHGALHQKPINYKLPGPWIAIPTEVVHNIITSANLTDITSELWRTIVVKSIFLCGHRVSPHDTPHISLENILNELLHDVNDNIEIAHILWYGVERLNTWIDRKNQEVINTANRRLKEAQGFTEHLANDIEFLNNEINKLRTNHQLELQNQIHLTKIKEKELNAIRLSSEEQIKALQKELKTIYASSSWKILSLLKRWSRLRYKDR